MHRFHILIVIMIVFTGSVIAQDNGWLKVTINISDANLYVDDILVKSNIAAGVAVIEPLSPGEHIVKATREGSFDEIRTITIKKAEVAKLEIEFKSVSEIILKGREEGLIVQGFGKLTILSTPPGADIYLGRDLYRGAKTPDTFEKIPTGKIWIGVKLNDLFQEKLVKIVKDSTVIVDFNQLEKITSPQESLDILNKPNISSESFKDFVCFCCGFKNPALSKLCIQCGVNLKSPDITRDSDCKYPVQFTGFPEGSDIIIENHKIGKIPIDNFKMSSGEYSIYIRKNAYYSITEDITVLPSRDNKFHYQLKPKSKAKEIILSIFMPGVGQLYMGSKRGWLYTLAFAGFGVTGIVQNVNMKKAVDEYNSSVQEGNLSWAELNSDYDSIKSTKNIRNLMYIGALVTYGLNLFDVILWNNPKAFNPFPEIGFNQNNNEIVFTVSIAM